MKSILLVATGGTIASVEDEGGLAPALGGEELARYVPELGSLCAYDVVQPMNIDSTNMRPADWMRMRDVIVDAYDDYDGFVVLHGTDTMAAHGRRAFVPDPGKPQAHRADGLPAADGQPLHRRQAQRVPKRALCA